MLYRLRRHPFPVVAHFDHVLVLTYAFPRSILEPMLPPGLTLDARGELGFMAVAMVQTRRLRPAFLPARFGQDFFLAGYRIFARFRRPSGGVIRGLRILRSDADRRLMVWLGNALTHYHYRPARVAFELRTSEVEVRISTPAAEADLHVRAELTPIDGLPPGSPFATLHEARRFAGPLPWTLDYEPQTHSIVLIKGVRDDWAPQPVAVDVLCNTFIQHPRFDGVRPILAAAFHVADVSYRWERGVRVPLEEVVR